MFRRCLPGGEAYHSHCFFDTAFIVYTHISSSSLTTMSDKPRAKTFPGSKISIFLSGIICFYCKLAIEIIGSLLFGFRESSVYDKSAVVRRVWFRLSASGPRPWMLPCCQVIWFFAIFTRDSQDYIASGVGTGGMGTRGHLPLIKCRDTMEIEKTGWYHLFQICSHQNAQFR